MITACIYVSVESTQCEKQNVILSCLFTFQLLVSLLAMIAMVEGMPQLAAHPNAAHTSLADPSLSAHPNAAHTFPENPSLSAHPNAAHTFANPDCARFSGAFPCAPGDNQCAADYKVSGCGK